MKKVYFFRHGQTDWNKEHKMQGVSNIPLNETGIQQAMELSNKVKDLDIDIILCSDLDRAMKTAEIANQHNNIPVKYSPALQEINSGDAEGMFVEEAFKKYKDILEKVDKLSLVKDNHNSIPNGESPSQVVSRVKKYLKSEIKNNNYQNVAVSTHGGVLKFLMMDQFNVIQKFANCELIALNYCPDQEKFFRID